jgi:hypothetical protein
MLLSAASMVLCAIIFIPIISRGYDGDALLKVTQLIILHAFFGAFEFLRPVFISHYDARLLSFKDLVTSSSISFLLFSPLLLILLFLVFDVFSANERILILVAFYLYIVYSCLWPFLDKNFKTGLGMLTRSLATVFIYLLLAIFPIYLPSYSSVYALTFSHFLVFIVFFIFTARYIVFTRALIGPSFLLNVLQVVYQNFFRSINDFFDRVFFTIVDGGKFSAVYNLFYDVAAKCNSPTQLLAVYCYPQLQEDKAKIKYFFSLAAIFSCVLSLLALLLFFNDFGLVKLYFG